MKTTAGICSTSARYRGSTLGPWPSFASLAAFVRRSADAADGGESARRKRKTSAKPLSTEAASAARAAASEDDAEDVSAVPDGSPNDGIAKVERLMIAWAVDDA